MLKTKEIQTYASVNDHAVINNDFSLRLLGQLPKKGNLFYSPFNIRAALSMVYAGARTKTAEEMSSTCGFAKAQKEHHLMMAVLMDGFGMLNVLRLANNVWISNEQQVSLIFKKVVEEMYKAPFETVDFKNDFEGVRRKINQWVEKQTADKIKDLLPQNSVNSETRMVLVSAIYFKDMWRFTFDKDETEDAPFITGGGYAAPVKMMSQKAKFGYAETDSYQLLEMSYKSNLSFVAVLPRKVDGLPALEREIAQRGFEFAAPHQQEVQVFLPRFKLEYSFSVKDMLIAMGMPLAFSDKADFSGIATGNQALKIDDVIHKAFCEVNEEGTEAAAATAVVMMKLASFQPRTGPKVFRADHPFLFFIRENAAGHTLFAGRVEDPR